MPPRVEVRDFVACRFQLRLQLENLRARFRIKIRRRKRGLQIRHGSRPDSKMNHVPVILTALSRQVSVWSFMHRKRLTIGGLECDVRQTPRLFEHEVSDSGFEIPIDYRDRR